MSDLPELSLAVRDGVLVATVRGEVDLANGPELEAAVLGRTADDAPRGVVVDLTEVTFLDSAGVRFVDHVAAATTQRPLLVVAAAAGRARFTLRLCGFPDDLVREDLDGAVSELREPPGDKPSA